MIAVLFAAGIGVLCCCCCGMAKKSRKVLEHEAQRAVVQPTPKAPKLPEQPQKTYCDAGVMGPVHYNG
eukprot:6904638-Pyramimonas_sp.AAC.1